MTAIVSIQPSGSISIINFEDGASFRCTRDFVRRSNLKPGQQIEQIFVDRLRESASFDLALSQARRLNRKGRYSRREMSHKLQQAEIPDSDIKDALDTLSEQGEIDEQAVATELARRSLQRALSHDPDLSWSRFRDLHGRRFALRGFGVAESNAALRQVWLEREASPLAPHR